MHKQLDRQKHILQQLLWLKGTTLLPYMSVSVYCQVALRTQGSTSYSSGGTGQIICKSDMCGTSQPCIHNMPSDGGLLSFAGIPVYQSCQVTTGDYCKLHHISANRSSNAVQMHGGNIQLPHARTSNAEHHKTNS